MLFLKYLQNNSVYNLNNISNILLYNANLCKNIDRQNNHTRRRTE
jgi:hypothetical protein